MKVVLAGAFGHLGAEILKCLCASGEHEVVAAARRETQIPECKGKYRFVKIDATDPKTMQGLCARADVVITTVGLTGASTKVTSYDIDYVYSDRCAPFARCFRASLTEGENHLHGD